MSSKQMLITDDEIDVILNENKCPMCNKKLQIIKEHVKSCNKCNMLISISKTEVDDFSGMPRVAIKRRNPNFQGKSRVPSFA